MPTRKIFLDTSYLLALELANDQNHQAAQAHWQQVITTSPAFVTTSYIFDEVVTYFNSRYLRVLTRSFVSNSLNNLPEPSGRVCF